jgi:hypothetical protein
MWKETISEDEIVLAKKTCNLGCQTINPHYTRKK